MKIKSFLLFFLFSNSVFSQTSHKLAEKSSNVQISAFGICKKISNSSGYNYFIPVSTLNEWSSFLTYLPPQVSANNCGPGPVDCVGAWSACLAGQQTYQISTPASSGGLSCPFAQGATQSCCWTPEFASGSYMVTTFTTQPTCLSSLSATSYGCVLCDSADIGVCGSANGTTTPYPPSALLCSKGNLSQFSGSGPWSWKCGTDQIVTCTANKMDAVKSFMMDCGKNGCSVAAWNQSKFWLMDLQAAGVAFNLAQIINAANTSLVPLWQACQINKWYSAKTASVSNGKVTWSILAAGTEDTYTEPYASNSAACSITFTVEYF